MTASTALFVGIDLGGARGKTTAVARLRSDPAGQVLVEAVARRHQGHALSDSVLLDYLAEAGAGTLVAVNAPLTTPACVRCRLAACPGVTRCVDPAVVWLRAEGVALASARHEVAGVIGHVVTCPPPRSTLQPYLHRCTEVLLHQRGMLPRDAMGKSGGPLAGRAGHLRRRLGELGFVLHQDLIEVAPQVTVRARFGARLARGYKRDADPWRTRAAILESMTDLRFAPSSRLAREETLQNDHCFEAVLAGYTAYLRSRDGWQLPGDVFTEDGWIFAPP